MEDYRFYKYINERSMLVITPKNELKRLYCPFPVADLKGNLFNVTSIAASGGFEIYYKINGKHQLHSDYKIKS